MLFSEDKKSGETCLRLNENGISKGYKCNFNACQNPICNCGSLDISVTPLGSENHKPAHMVPVDVIEKKLYTAPKTKMPSADSNFAGLLLSQMGEKDFDFLWKKYFAHKNKITESAVIDDIEAIFDYEDVEMDGLMYAYNDVLPFGDQLGVNIGNKTYMMIDQFCLLPKCSCTETIIGLVPQSRDWFKMDGCGTMKLIYAEKHWEEEDKLPLPLEEVRAAIEAQHPDFYGILKKRHEKVKKIYLNCRKKHFASQRAVTSRKAGRNDPCPCGSGKKYKKCCLRKEENTGVPEIKSEIPGLDFFPGNFKF